MHMGKYITAGVGFSKKDNPKEAAEEAAKKALAMMGKKKPQIAFVLYAGNYDADKLNSVFVKELKKTEFVGGSTDAVIYNGEEYPKGIVVACLQSDYMHFGTASTDNITKNPAELSRKTATEAVAKIPMDKYLDSYMAFSRVKKGSLQGLIRTPSFFVIAFTRGFQLNRFGNEDTIIEGIADATGQYVPIFGGSLGNDMDKVFKNEPYEITTFHSGKVMKDGLVVVFVSTGLVYVNTIAHGAKTTQTQGYISEVKNDGFVVSRINDKPIRDWYAENIGITRKVFDSKVLYYTQKYPLGFPDGFGNIIMRAGGVPYGDDAFMYIAPFKANTPVFLMNVEGDEKLLAANKDIKESIEHHLKKKNLCPAFSFLASCSSRRRILSKEAYKKELAELAKTCDAPLFGFASFGEIGSRPAEACHFNHLCSNILNIYEILLPEI